MMGVRYTMVKVLVKVSGDGVDDSTTVAVRLMELVGLENMNRLFWLDSNSIQVSFILYSP
jgi:hypothetical protein